MILQPLVISLLFICLITTGLVLGAASCGVRILRRWDIGSGSEEQLALERKTYLVSMILSYVLALEIGSFFLFIYAADGLHSLFTGAMCAAGTLNVNDYGYPTLLVKIVNLLLAGVWLIVNFVDNRAHDYPLIKVKYGLLLVLAPLIAAETIVEGSFFLQLKGDVITSCCGSLFSSDSRGIASEMAGLPVHLALPVFFLGLVATGVSGTIYRLTEKGALLFSFMSSVNFILSVTALISFISLYFYELPTHHCPFCVLQDAYGYVGYFLYGALLLGAVSGISAGVLSPFRETRSLFRILPHVQRRLVCVCLASYGLFAATSIWRIIFSRLTMW